MSIARRMPIALKISLVIVIPIIVGVVAVGSIFIKQQSELLNKQIDQHGQTLIEQLSRMAAEPVLANDRHAIAQLVESSKSSRGVKGAQLLGHDGEVLAQLGVNQAIEQHKNGAGDWSFFDNLQRKFTTYSAPILFRDATLGQANITLEYDYIPQSIIRSASIVAAIALGLALFGLFMAFMIARQITLPLRQMIKASKKIAKGDYDFRFNDKGKDEIGLLMQAMDKLTDGLVEKRQVEHTLSRYVSDNVARSVLSDSQATALGGTTVNASVIFADICGFTKMSESMDVADVQRLLNEYFGVIDKAAKTCRGYIDKFIGDAAMIVFGAPEANEKHALDAVKCATLMQEMISALNNKREQRGMVTVEFRVGINSGPMMAGNVGSEERCEFTVVGDAVNLASRLAGVAQPGEIVLSRSVLEEDSYIKLGFMLDNIDTIKVKGKSKPIPIYRVSRPIFDAMPEVFDTHNAA